MSDDSSALSQFKGVARLFPLPNLVFFPHVIQPLHIFEPRYREMTADALTDDRLIALVMLRDAETADQARAAIYSVACLGKVVADQRLDDGRYNLLLRGLARILIRRGLETGKLFRSAEVEVLHDQPASEPQAEADLRDQLAKNLPLWFPGQDQVAEQFHKLLDSELSLSALCDIFCFALPLTVEFKQSMLEQLDVAARTRALLQCMQGQKLAVALNGPRKWPPDFSKN
jgi:Lon protease-like protein